MFTKSFWLSALMVAWCPALAAQETFAGSSTVLSSPLQLRVHSKTEQKAAKELVKLVPQIGNDMSARKTIAIALARLGATDAALSIAQGPSLQNEVKQMAALRSIFAGTHLTAQRWISQLPSSQRPNLQLQLARRFLREKQSQKALEILRGLSRSKTPKTLQVAGDVAVALAEAGDKVEAQKRFDSIDAQLRKFAARGEEPKEVNASERGVLTLFRLQAGLPPSAPQIIEQGKPSLMSSLTFYLETHQEGPAREILELLPAIEVLNLLSGPDAIIVGEEIQDIRRKLVREWLSKITSDKRGLYVYIESVQSGPTAAMNLIEEFLPPKSRQQAKLRVMLLAVVGDQIPADTRKNWGMQLLRALQIQRRQQLREPDNIYALHGTLASIFEVALAIQQNQVAQNALYEREKLPLGEWENEDGTNSKAETFAAEWDRIGNKKRAALWQQKIPKKKRQNGTLARLHEAIAGNRTGEVKDLLPHVSTKEWQQVKVGDIYTFVRIDGQESVDEVPTQMPTWFANLATAAQKVEALSQWASRVAPWEGMRWARVGEKMD